MILRLPNDVREELAKSRLPWRVEAGSRHYKLFVGPQLAAIFPKGGRHFESSGRADKNTLAQLRRIIRGQTSRSELNGECSRGRGPRRGH
jgi:hypothetical protein